MAIPTHQKALVLPSPRAAFVVQIVEAPKPEPDEVLVRIEAAALNPVDWKIQQFGIIVTKYPAIVGSDAAGVVVQAGSDVSDLSIGDRVYVPTSRRTRNHCFNFPFSSGFHSIAGYRSAGYQQFAVIRADLTLKVCYVCNLH